MGLFRHPKSGVWFIDLRHNGKRIKRSTRTRDKEQAKELHDRYKADLWRQSNLGDAPHRYWEHAALEYFKTVVHQRDIAGKKRYLRYWSSKLRGMPLTAITSDVIEQAAPTTQITKSGNVEPLTGATINRYLATISAVLRYAYKRGWLPGVPSISKRAEAPVRELFATREQADKLLDTMGDCWLRDVTEFAFFTGMRASEIFTLEWSNVTLNQGLVSLPGSRAKSGSGRAIPLNDRAMSVINRRRGKHEVYVFARRDKVAPKIDTGAFMRAAAAAGLPPTFRFHDCRHSWASWHAQRGTPMLTLQRLGGWKTLAMLNRYAHFATEDLARYAGAID